jgi:hypothetical protein
LAAVDTVEAVAPAVAAGGVQALAAEVAGIVGPGERGDHQVAGREPGHLGADVFDDPEELMAHGAALVRGRHAVVGMQVAAADRRPQHANHGVGGLVDLRIGPVLDADVAGAVHHCCTHALSLVRWVWAVRGHPEALWRGPDPPTGIATPSDAQPPDP